MPVLVQLSAKYEVFVRGSGCYEVFNMEWQYYHIVSMDLIARNTDFATNDQLFIDGKWVDDRKHIISDRQIGYDGERIGAGSILFDIEEITKEEAALRMTMLNKMRKNALLIACKAHRHQTDKAGEPYLKHPIQVASRFQDDARFIAGLLHGVLQPFTFVVMYNLYNTFDIRCDCMERQ